MTKSKNRPTKTTTARASKVRSKRRVYNSQTKKSVGYELESSPSSLTLK